MDNSIKMITVSIIKQELVCYEADQVIKICKISTGKNGAGEQKDSGCTPRGWHKIHAVIGLSSPINSVFVARQWTGDIYTSDLALQFPEKDWILTRILQLEGLEPGRNLGGTVDTLERFIYIHGTSDTAHLGQAVSQGCIRMESNELIALCAWVVPDVLVYVH